MWRSATPRSGELGQCALGGDRRISLVASQAAIDLPRTIGTLCDMYLHTTGAQDYTPKMLIHDSPPSCWHGDSGQSADDHQPPSVFRPRFA
jgi:hypothetical protein